MYAVSGFSRTCARLVEWSRHGISNSGDVNIRTASISRTSHPPGLYVLFFTELWERYSFYSMMAILSLYMNEALHFDVAKVGSIYGTYNLGRVLSAGVRRTGGRSGVRVQSRHHHWRHPDDVRPHRARGSKRCRSSTPAWCCWPAAAVS